jgi:mannose-6-phosphate isomerase-like protein (cupin superfamily)/SAM-dependent methyltransferase
MKSMLGACEGMRDETGADQMTHQPILRTPTEGRTIAVVGDVYRFIAVGEETGGRYALWEAIVYPGGGPPTHVHSREEEGFYILEGEITFQISEKRIVASAGMFANMPVGTPHSFRNESGKPAKMLISVAPAGLEQMFFEIGVPVEKGATTAPSLTKDEIERFLVVAPRYGIEVRLPPTGPDRKTFENFYAGKALWDIDGPQKPFVEVADRVTSSVLDAGCGTGENALFFAERGHPVLGIDFLEYPINEARRKTAERGLIAEFVQMDALMVSTFNRKFESVIDSGLFHVFSDEDRARYVAGLAYVTSPGGRLFLLCFSDEEPGTQGPRRVTERELRESFADGWAVEEVRPARFEVVPDLKDISFSEGGPKAWFSVIRRLG